MVKYWELCLGKLAKCTLCFQNVSVKISKLKFRYLENFSSRITYFAYLSYGISLRILFKPCTGVKTTAKD